MTACRFLTPDTFTLWTLWALDTPWTHRGHTVDTLRSPPKGNMAHNMWYWSLAIVQWTWWEAVMVRLWATGAVPYVTMKEIGDSW